MLHLVSDQSPRQPIGKLKDTRGATYDLVQKLPGGDCIVNNARGTPQLKLANEVKYTFRTR